MYDVCIFIIQSTEQSIYTTADYGTISVLNLLNFTKFWKQ